VIVAVVRDEAAVVVVGGEKPFASDASFHPAPFRTALLALEELFFESSWKAPGRSFSYVMFGLVPAATSTDRAGKLHGLGTAAEDHALDVTVLVWIRLDRVEVLGEGDPFPSALMISSWFSRYAGASTIRLRYASVTPAPCPHQR